MNDADTIEQIAEVIQSSLAVNGQLAFPFYKQFWANMHESPECAACYLAVLLSKLVGLTSGEDKHTPLLDLVKKVVSENYTISASDVQKLAPDADPTVLALRQSILLTLYFIGIHIRFAVVHPSMNLAFAKWIEFNAIQRWVSAKTPFVDEVISILSSSFDSDESLAQLIEHATTIDVPMDLCQDLGDARHLSRALLSAWLVRGSSFPLHKLIGAVLEVLKKDALPESRLLVVLHTLKKLVLHTPFITHNTIHNALSLLKSYYLWPRPYGDYAREVMEILSYEARNPGHTLRSLILHEFPNVLKDHPKVKYSRPAAHGRVIHMLVDTQHSEGSIMHDLLKSSPADDPSPAQLQIDLLGNIMYRVLGIEADVLGVEHCSQDLISELLAEALTVMDHAATLPENDARTYRLQHIKAIRDRILDNAEFDSYGYPPRHPTPPPFHMSIMQLKCNNTRPKRADELTDMQPRIPLRKNCVQALSQIFASYQHQNKSNSSPTFNRLSQKPTPNPPNFSVPLQDTNTKSNRKSLNASQTSPNQPQSPAPTQPRLVRIAVIGSDTALHNVVTGYVTLRREQPSLFVGLDVRFYVIPIACAQPLSITAQLPSPLSTAAASNHFASFIAKNDPWYYRHIWVGAYALSSILPSGSTSLSISQLQDLAADKPGNGAASSPRQRAKTRTTLSVPDIDRLASNGSLVESLKAVQKQKLASSAFLTAKPSEADGYSGGVGNGRLSSEGPIKPELVGSAEVSSDRERSGSGGNSAKDNQSTTSASPATTNISTTAVYNSTPQINANNTTVSATTTTITTNSNGVQEIIISGSSTEVLVLKKKKNVPPLKSIPTTTDTTEESKNAKNSNWATDSATEGNRRNGSVGSNPSSDRSRSNSGNDAEGIVVGKSRSTSNTNSPPVPNALNKSSSDNAIELSDPLKTEASNTKDQPINGTPTPVPAPSTALPPKAIFRRSNSMQDSLHVNHSSSDDLKKQVFSHKATLQHSHSVASFNFEPPNSIPPITSLSSTEPPTSVLQAPSPARMLRQEFDTYVRDATQYLNVAIFQAECWTTVDNEPFYFTVPFLIRAELGISAYARLFAETYDLPATFTQQDIATHKLFKYNPVPLSLKCTPVTLNGVARSVQVIEPRPYVTISISNLGPLDRAQQNNANPSRPWLELSSVEAESKKRKKEESHTYYVNVIDLETEGKKLVDVILDGEYYGGIYRLRITTCTAPPINRLPTPNASPSASTTPPTPVNSSPASPALSSSSSTIPISEEEQIVFPVMTYLPLNLP